jgi:LysM repeat protein
MFSKVFTLAAVLAISAQATSAACTRSYAIKAGDYCDKISQENNVSTFQLAALNDGKMNDGCTNLAAGVELCLGNTGEDCTTTYTVKAGDTCNAIMNAAGVNSTVLYLNNPQIDEECTNIYVGEVLCTGKEVQVPVTPPGGVVVPIAGPPANPPPAPAPAPAPAPPTPAPDHTDAPADNGKDAPADNGDDDDSDLPYCDEIDE